jgi:hypothetical protein
MKRRIIGGDSIVCVLKPMSSFFPSALILHIADLLIQLRDVADLSTMACAGRGHPPPRAGFRGP